jgi:hypothetical protein
MVSYGFGFFCERSRRTCPYTLYRTFFESSRKRLSERYCNAKIETAAVEGEAVRFILCFGDSDTPAAFDALGRFKINIRMLHYPLVVNPVDDSVTIHYSVLIGILSEQTTVLAAAIAVKASLGLPESLIE